MVNNQGIVHLRYSKPGWYPVQLACRQRRAHLAVSFEQFAQEPENCRCKRCNARFMEQQNRQATKPTCDDAEYLREQARAAELARRGASNW